MLTKAMPLGNRTGMLDEERALSLRSERGETDLRNIWLGPAWLLPGVQLTPGLEDRRTAFDRCC